MLYWTITLKQTYTDFCPVEINQVDNFLSISQWESKVERGQEEFDNICRMIKKELERFELLRVQEFKVILIRYIESLMKNQQQVKTTVTPLNKGAYNLFCSSSKSGSHSCLKPRQSPDHSIVMLLQAPLLATKLIPYLITW